MGIPLLQANKASLYISSSLQLKGFGISAGYNINCIYIKRIKIRQLCLGRVSLARSSTVCLY